MKTNSEIPPRTLGESKAKPMQKTRDSEANPGSAGKKETVKRPGTADYGNTLDPNNVESEDGGKKPDPQKTGSQPKNAPGSPTPEKQIEATVGNGQARGYRKEEEGGTPFTGEHNRPKEDREDAIEKR